MAAWDEDLATVRLSERARRVGAAYAGPGSGGDIPRGERPPIAFTGGLPDPVLLPAGEIAELTAAVLRDEPNWPLQYGGPQGWEGLREWLAEHWTAIDGVAVSPAHYTLTNGSAGALANICDTFLDPGDIVGVEEYSFPGSVRTIRGSTPRIECIPMDDDGIDVDALEGRLSEMAMRGDRMRLLYTIPTYQNPTGSSLSSERRTRLVEVCARHEVLIVEDVAYEELYFGDRPPSSLYSLADGDGVIKIGSFSKVLAPGLRVGWCQASPKVVDALVATRGDLGTSPLLIRVVARFATTRQAEHVAQLRTVYARKCQTMLDALDAHCSGAATWNRPGGGFFVWMTIGDAVAPLTLADTAQDEAVSYVGGHVFSSEVIAGEGRRMAWGPGDSRFLRLAFSYVPEDDIAEGIARLGRALRAAAEPRT